MPPQVRTVGREAEFPLVDAEGRAADASRLWPLLLESGDCKPVYDEKDDGSEFIIGVEHERWSCVIEVGKGTVEISVGPKDTLHELARDFDAALRRVWEAASGLGLYLLGYGIQPLSSATKDLLTPKRRYVAMLEAIGPQWLSFCVTAGDQAQIDMGRDEIARMTNLIGAVSGAIIAFTANSSVYGGASGEFASGRQGLAEGITGEPHRHGAAPRPFHDLEAYVRFLAGLRCLCLPHASGGYRLPEGAFSDFLRGFRGDSEAAHEAFLFHEHYVWCDARPRARIGTLEVRPSCQQPAELSWTPSALSLGLIEAADDVEAFIEGSVGGGSWEKLMLYRERAVKAGIHAPEPAAGFLRGLLDLARKGLWKRGFGEEKFIDPLEDVLEFREGSAANARRAFERGGTQELVSEYAIN
ncbi:MAG: glutamate-cysteine ligase family protein [Rubrobacteraceae bacterium]